MDNHLYMDNHISVIFFKLFFGAYTTDISEKNMFTKSKHRFSHHVQNIFVRKRFFEIKKWVSKKLLCDLMNFVEQQKFYVSCYG